MQITTTAPIIHVGSTVLIEVGSGYELPSEMVFAALVETFRFYGDPVGTAQSADENLDFLAAGELAESVFPMVDAVAVHVGDSDDFDGELQPAVFAALVALLAQYQLLTGSRSEFIYQAVLEVLAA